MKKIIGILRPFDIEQNFYVYENGNKIGVGSCQMDDIPKTIFKLVNEYDIDTLDLAGPKQYAKGLSLNIQKFELTEYNENKLTINII